MRPPGSRGRGLVDRLKASSFAGIANSNSSLTVMSSARLLPFAAMAFRSLFNPHSHDKSTLLIDDDIRLSFSKNLAIDALELRKERGEPQHEFIVLTMERTRYLMERRPSKGTSLGSVVSGCKTEDTITRLEWDHLQIIERKTYPPILASFPTNQKPDLFTVFAICDAIRKDPDSNKYTLLEYNCYFFARTLTLLLIRYFLLRQYCRIHKSPGQDFRDFPGPAIDVIGDKAASCWPWGPIQFTVRMILLKFGLRYDVLPFFQSNDVKGSLGLRLYIRTMNLSHCFQWFDDGDVTYDKLIKKKEEIWGRMYSNSTSSESKVAVKSHAMVQSDKDIKKLLLASSDDSVWRFAREFDWTEEVVHPVVVKKETNPSFSETKNTAASQPKNTVAGKKRREEDYVNKDASIFWSSTVSEQFYLINAWLFLQLSALPYPAGLVFAFIVAGAVLWVWLYGAFVAKVLCTVLVVVFLFNLSSFLSDLSGCLI